MSKVKVIIAGWVLGLLALPNLAQESRQATGVKVGEVSDVSSIVWMRVTAEASRNSKGIVGKGKPAEAPPPDAEIAKLEGACPGAPGQVRLRYSTREDLGDASATG